MTSSHRTWIAALSLSLATLASASVQRADFGRERPSADARQLADWVVESNDNKRLSFVVIDKVNARAFVFDPQGHLRGAAPVLLGLARGDHTVPGIADKELGDIKRNERTTPAGRFVAERGRNLAGEDIVWVDYDAAVSMHRMRSIHASERRAQRMASPTPKDNRISYGCINVPPAFFDKVVSPAFSGGKAIVYVLPEIRPLNQVFRLNNVERRARELSAAAR